MSMSLAISYRWFLNEFPNFLLSDDSRYFISQVTGDLHVAKTQANDSGNYFCFATIKMEISTKSIFSKAVPLTVQPDGKPLLLGLSHWVKPLGLLAGLTDLSCAANTEIEIECF